MHALPSSTSGGSPPTQAPFPSQESGDPDVPVQAFPSSHGLSCGVQTQPVAGSQESIVHSLPSSQSIGTLTAPVSGSQESSVHASPSSASGGSPPTQVPAPSQ